MKLEIYDDGLYIDVERDTIEELRQEMLNYGNKAYDKFIQKNTTSLKLNMSKDEYIITGRHGNVWFSARVTQ
jgi:hypothetical protein